MNAKVAKLLNDQGGNYIFPFFWQHGEDETILWEYMQVIDESNIKAVCVESRPHPDFCGPKWWEDMDVILDEARKRNMKVWILDDSHFPTGFANGALSEEPDERCRQGLCCKIYDCQGKSQLQIEEQELHHPQEWKPNQIEMHIGEKTPRRFEDDKLLGAYAVRVDEKLCGFEDEAYRIDLEQCIKKDTLIWDIPERTWKVYLLHLSRNVGYHRNYINMMDAASCRVLLNTVYEPHYVRYKADFGNTIAGFFSDEPELGNGHLYEQGLTFGNYEDLPWSEELEVELRLRLGIDFAASLALLWEESADAGKKARIRYHYMDAVTRLVEKDFSKQIGEWCRAHNVQYIGHVIEDNNQHARLGSSLGHYYRGLSGQDMAGIDNIGGQVLPQQETVDIEGSVFGNRIGEFYHYMLGKLGSSAAAIEPLKQGNSMCEIFGAYGWSAGVRLEKYLLDHFLVRGINHFVRHAFSPKEFPDQDCPPHFYAHGHNPQYRHFGSLMAYTNRVCELISDGKHIATAAVLYHVEGEWTGDCMFSHQVGHVLADAQIEYDYIPQDVFAERETFHTVIEEGILKVNTQEYKILIVPTMQFVTQAFAEAVLEMQGADIQVWFVNEYPEGICDMSAEENLIIQLRKCNIVKLEEISDRIKELKLKEITLMPANDRIRYYHYAHNDSTSVYLFSNEGTEIYQGVISLAETGNCYIYDAWENCLRQADCKNGRLTVTIEPLKLLIIVGEDAVHLNEIKAKPSILAEGKELILKKQWRRSICKSIEYPDFGATKEIVLPDLLAEEEPKFSGFVRYENVFIASGKKKVVMEISDAREGVEVFVNGNSLGIQIAPPFMYNLSDAVVQGENQIVIEVATTLERAMADVPDMLGQKSEPTALSGITGEVKIHEIC